LKEARKSGVAVKYKTKIKATTGKSSTTHTNFSSENWLTNTKFHLASIEQNVSKERFDEIWESALQAIGKVKKEEDVEELSVAQDREGELPINLIGDGDASSKSKGELDVKCVAPRISSDKSKSIGAGTSSLFTAENSC
jgi:hypothetical protein